MSNSKQIQYYTLGELDAKAFQPMLEKALSRVDAAVEGVSDGPLTSLDEMARFIGMDAAI